MARGLLLVLLATPVCAAVCAMVAVASVDVFVTGEPYTGAEFGSAVVFFFGPLILVGLAIFLTLRSKERRPVMAAILAVTSIAGAGAGGWFGWNIVQEKHASMDAHVAEACGWLAEPPEGCAEHARACIYGAREHPEEVGRGLNEFEDDVPEVVPQTPHDRAVYRCLVR